MNHRQIVSLFSFDVDVDEKKRLLLLYVTTYNDNILYFGHVINMIIDIQNNIGSELTTYLEPYIKLPDIVDRLRWLRKGITNNTHKHRLAHLITRVIKCQLITDYLHTGKYTIPFNHQHIWENTASHEEYISHISHDINLVDLDTLHIMMYICHITTIPGLSNTIFTILNQLLSSIYGV